MFTQLLSKVRRVSAHSAIILGFLAPALLNAQPCPQLSFSGNNTIENAADGAYAVFAVDLDGDGDADVLSASFNDDKIAWYENLGAGNFGAQQVISTNAGGALSVHAADLDGDGDADVLSAAGFDDKIAWYENLGGGSFSTEKVITTIANGALSVHTADIDGDGDLDVLSASVFDDKIAWYENLGGGSFSGEMIISLTADGAYDVFATDLDNDGDPDVLVASGFDDQISWYENIGGGSFSAKKIITVNANLARSVYAADLNGDGYADVLSASFQDDKVAWYENQGDGTFSGQQVISFAANGALSVYATDLDNDGDLDVLSASQYDDEIAWYENLGDGSFSTQNIIEGNADGAISVFAADLDNDGDMDVLSAANYDDEIAWYENICVYPFQAGTITTGGETICFGAAPTTIIGSEVLASGGDEVISYTWRSSADNFVAPIPNATAPIYIPQPGLTQTTTFRRYANDGTYNPTPTASNGEWTITVLDEFDPGQIASSSQTICYGGTPVEIGSDAPATGGDGQITYTWRSSADNFSNPIPGADGLVYTPPTGLTESTSYQRYANDGTCNTSPVPATGSGPVLVLADFNSGQIADDGETICPGGTPSEIQSEALAIGGDGQITYSWRSSADNYSAVITGADSATYTPETGLMNTTTFRRYAEDGFCNTDPAVSLGEWTVTVADTSPPLAVCQDITIPLDPLGQAVIVPGDVDGGSSDDCGIDALTISESDFDCSKVGANLVTLTVEDIGGNTDACTATVIVEDNVLPTALCQEVTIYLNNDGLGSLTPQEVDAGSNDACTLENLALDVTAFDCADIGANTVTLTAEDVNDNVSTCEATVTVVDTIPPQALCQDVTVQLDANGVGTLSPNDVDAGSNDACGISGLSIDTNGFDCTDTGSNPVVLTVEDANGNSSVCTATVTVTDTVAPEMACQDATVLLDANGLGSLDIADIDAGTSDACGLDTLFLSQTDFDCADVGLLVLTLAAEDINGNSNTCTASVTVEDNIAPTVTCGDAVLILDNGGLATLTLSDVNGSFSDACGISNDELDKTDFDCADIGANTVTLTVTDNNGNVETCISTVTVEDTIPPVVLCQDVTVQLDIDGVGILTVAEVDAGSIDVCLDTLTLNETIFGCGNVGSNIVTLTATDLDGNSSTCTAEITVEDNVPPVAGCQDANVQLDSLGFAVLLPADVESGSTDACGIGPLLLDQAVFGCDDLGSNPVTLTVEDENGNSSTCSATVTVADPIAPVAECQNVTVQLNADGQGSLATATVDAGSTDNCDVASLSLNADTFDCDDIGPNPVVLTVTDQSGNASTCAALVTVEDMISPQALCQDVTVQLDANGDGSLLPAEVNGGSADACGTLSFSLDQSTFACADVGANTVTLTVEDEFGNSSTCSATVTVEDNVEPLAVCQAAVVQLDAGGAGILSAAAIDGGSSDACGVNALALNISEFDCNDIGANTVSLTVIDVNGNSSSCTATVTVEDNVAPTALCQNTTVQLSVSGVGELLPTQIDNGSSDACGIANLSLSQNSFGCGDIGDQSVTLTVTDNNGNANSCVATVTVEDNVVPEAICEDVTVQLDANGAANVLVTQVDNGSNDACGIAGLSLDVDVFDCTNVGDNLVTLMVIDTHGNLSDCKAVVTVEDNTAPEALCQPVTIQLDAAGSAALSTAQVDNGSNDACGLASLELDVSSFGCDDVGANGVVLTVTDVNGNTNSCTASVTVEDNIDPVALCQPVTVQLDGNGTGLLEPADVDAGSSDVCGIGTFTLSENTFDCDDVGTQTVTLTVTDSNGNTATCDAVITIEDNVVPVALCQDATVQLDASGTVTLSPADIDGGSAGACGVSSLVLSEDTFGCAEIGANVVTLIVIDVNGNASTCSAVVTVEDNVAPNAICQDVTVQLNAAGEGSLTAAQVDGGSSDACGISSFSVDQESFDCQDVGQNAVALTVTDIHGNSSTCSALVTVEDNVAPEALCQNVTIQLDTDGNGSLTAAQVDAGSNDVCSLSGLSLNVTAFDCADVGANTVTLTATDANGNNNMCTATVTVEDNIPPVMLCNDLTIQLSAGGTNAITADQIDGGSSDACGISSLAIDDTTFDCTEVGSNTVTLTATDANGNSNTCTATVTVEDTTLPEALCQDITVQLGTDGTLTVNPAQVDAGSNDACSISSLALNVSDFDCTDVGDNVVALTVTDENGNASSCTATITVEDNTAPEALCQNITVQLGADGTGSLAAAQVDNGSNDACGIAQLSLDLTTFDCGDVGSNVVTLTVTDVNGNSSTCASSVTVEDNIAPLALCQNATVQLNPSGTALLSAAQINAGSTDACGIALQGLNITTFDCDDAGPNQVILTLTDVNGNTSTCTSTVIVEDTVAPIASCANITAQLDANGTVTITPDQVDNGSSDACGIAGLSLDVTTFGCADLADNTVTLTVTDEGSNSSTCTSIVTVEDNVAPQALCQDVTVQLSGTGIGTLSVGQVDAGSSDACGIDEVNLSVSTFGCGDVGDNIVVLTVTDVNGNSGFCSATVTVEDNTPPVALCQNTTVVLDAGGFGSVAPVDLSNGFVDACGLGSLSIDQTDFDCSDIGPNTVTLTQTDENGNEGTCTAIVTVVDNTSPQALCQDVTVQLNEAGDGVLPPALVNAGSNDICGIDWTSLDITQFDCDDAGPNIVTLTVADINGNLSTCTATATVEDNIAPVALCQDVFVEAVSDDAFGLVPADFDNGSTDACGIGSFSLNITTLSCADFGTNPVTLTVMDVNGNTSTCTAMAIVQDSNGPTAICPGDITVDTDPGDCSAVVNYDEPTAVFVCEEAISGDTLEYSGTIQTFVVPEGVTSIKIEAFGAQGGDANVGFGGRGAYMSGTFSVTPGQVLDVLVGEKPAVSNGGGGGTFVVDQSTGTPLVIAGGGGGGAGFCCGTIHDGAPGQTASFGSGGINASGGAGAGGSAGNGGAVGAATQQSGAGGGFFTDGANGDCSSTGGRSYQTGGFGGQSGGIIEAYGGFGGGGGGYNCGVSFGPGGGGGGYSGGGASGGGDQYGAGGGGGSFNSGTAQANVTELNSGHGEVILSWDASATVYIDQIDGTGLTSGSTFPTGTTTLSYLATDYNGNTDVCTFEVVVEDNEAPAIACLSDTVYLDASGNGATTVGALNGGVSDNCPSGPEPGGVASVTAAQTSFDCSDVGINDITLTAEDVYGNTGTCTASVTVLDTIAPVVTCEDLTLPLNGAGMASITLDDLLLDASDACDDPLVNESLSLSVSEFDCADVGTNTVVITGSDPSGNTSTCTAVVTIVDDIPPVALCQDITIELDDDGAGEITPELIDGGSSDICAGGGLPGVILSIVSDTIIFGCGDVGDQVVTLTVEDASGNTSTCTSTVTVVDNIGPNMICQDATVQLDASGTATILQGDIDNGSSDACGIESWSWDIGNFDCDDIGLNTLTLSATDYNGNSSTCTFTVTVEDVLSPELICEDLTVQLDASGTAMLTPAQVGGTINEACGLSELSLDRATFDCGDIGTQNVTLTAVDVSENSSQCTVTATVADTISPIAVCQDVVLLLDANGAAELTTAQVDAGSSDACGIADLSLDKVAFGCGDVGDQMVALTVTDDNGNTSSCNSAITIIDDVAPVAICRNVTVQLDALGNATIDASEVNDGSTDACGISSLSLNTSAFGCADVGDQSVTLTVEDENGNTGLCTATVTIEDNVAPGLSCEGLTVQLDEDGLAGISPEDIAGSPSDACGIVSTILSVSEFGCADIGENPVTLTVMDENSNTSACTVPVVVEDNIPPVASCLNLTLQLDEGGAVILTPEQLGVGSSDACGVDLSFGGGLPSVIEFGCGEVGPQSVALVVTDANGNSSTCTSTITIEDNVPPVAVCQDITVQLGALGTASITGDQIDNGVEDACGIESLSLDMNAFDCTEVGAHVATLTVEDENGNTSSCTSTVTVEDNIAPVLECEDATVQLDEDGLADLMVAAIAGSPVDGCGVVSTELDVSSFDCGDVGTNPVTLTVEDDNGNISSCTVTVTVEDNVAPVALCQDVIVELDTEGSVTLAPAQVNDGSSDACGLSSLSLDVTSFGCGDVGTQVVTLTATDNNGNADACTASITVQDNVAPIAVCQDLTVELNALGNASFTAVEIDNGSGDACGINSRTLDVTSFGCSDVGAQTVTLTIEDENGNTSSCTSTVTVEDNIAPVLECEDATVQLDEDGLASLTISAIAGSPVDGCGVVSTELDVSSFDCGDVGTNPVTLTVEDDNGNISSCTVTVTVEDNVAPVALCQNITLQLDAGGAVLLTPQQLDAGASDACGIALAFGDDLPSVIEFGCGDVGVQAVPVIVTDNNGNSSNCTSNVTIEDNVTPVAICQDASVTLDELGNAGLLVAAIDNGSNDACGIESLSLNLPDFDCSNIGGQLVTLTVEDENGNISTCQSTVTVEDDTPPVASCQNITVELGPDGTATIGVDQINNGTSDACGLAEIGLNIATFDCADIGPNNVLLTAQDFSGNMSACMAVVTVVDNITPEALCGDVTVQLDATGNGNLSAVQVDAGSTDACGIAGLSLTATSFDCTDIGLNSVVLTVTDVNGNASTCTSTVTVEDNIAPEALCGDVTVELNVAGSASLSTAQVDAGSNDACGIAGLSLNTTSFNCADVGLNTVVLTVEDVNGNSSTCTAEITVEDNTTPTALCEDLTVQLDGAGTANITSGQVFDGEIDPCGLANLSIDISSFDCTDVGDNSVTLTATDINGNSSSCVATVTVEDNIAPQALCQDLTIQLDAAGNGALTAGAVDNGSADACGIADLSLSTSSFGCSDVGAQSVTLTVTDNNGNSSSCVSAVTVEDNVAPEALCRDATVQLDAGGAGIVTIADVDAGSSDACGIVSLSFNIASFDCDDLGEQTVILFVSDNNGNTSNCTATVTVEESVAPQALCQDVVIQLNAAGTANLTAGQVDAGSADACGLADLSLSATSFDCGDVGSQVVALTVTDNSGNTSSCTSTITVEDNVAPQALCQDVAVQLDAAGNGTLTAGQVDAGSADACGIANLSLNTTSFDCSDTGLQAVTLTVTDNNGNSSSCVSTVTVEDNIVPQALCQNVTVQLSSSGTGTLMAGAVDNGSADACGLSNLSLSVTSFDCGDVGQQPVTLTATDNSGNSNSCVATVTVEDNVAPQALCQNITIQLDASGVAGLVPAQIDAGSNDACGIANLSLTPTAFGCAAIGQQQVMLFVTDNNGNSSSCMSTVTVEDNVAPSAVCQDVTIQLDAAGDASLTAAQIDNGSADACGIASQTIDVESFSCGDVGDQVVTLLVEDVNGNFNSCAATVTVVDNTPPAAVCQDITVELSPSGTASITPSDINNGSSDVCGVSSFSLSLSIFGADDIGDNTVTLTVIDANGNSNFCTSTVTVEDNIPRPGGIGNTLMNDFSSSNSSVGAYQAMVFPNPTLGVFSLRFERPLDAKANAILRNELGQEIGQATIPAGTTEHRWANVYLAAGLYYLEVQHGDGSREVLKIIRKQY